MNKPNRILANLVCPWCFRIRGPWHWLLSKADVCQGRGDIQIRPPFDFSGRECPRCREEIPDEDDETGDGAVIWRVTGKPYCSMECVLDEHMEWLNKTEGPTRS